MTRRRRVAAAALDDRAQTGRRARNGDVRVHLVVPKSFNDAQQIADKFKDSIPVILNLQSSETDLSKRLIDFASGLTYALDGGMQRIADKVFMLTPRNVEISAEERAPADREGLLQPVLTRDIRRLAASSRLCANTRRSLRPGETWTYSLDPRRSLDGRSLTHMQIGLIGAGNMARALARGWGRPVLCADPVAERARGARRARSAARRSRATPRWPSAPIWSCSATSPPSCDAVAARGRARCQRGRLDPRGDAAGGAEGGLPRAPRLPLHPLAARRGAPGRGRAGGGPAAGPRARRRGRRAVRRARHAGRARRRARGRGDGPDVLCARLRGAGRGGADRRGRATRDPRRAGRGAGGRRRSPAPPSCCAVATTTRWRSAARSPRRAA